jgi:hypothetical protein
VKTLKFSGEVPVDEKFCESFDSNYRVYREGNTVYDCMLNQVKFFLLR